MSARRSVVLAAFWFTTTAGLFLSPAPQVTRYRIETKSEQIADLSAIGQGEKRTRVGLINFLTVTLNDSAGGKTVHAVLDSVTRADTSSIPDQATLDSIRGRAWRAFLSSDGKMSAVQALDTTATGGQLNAIIANFFPRVKHGAKVGDQWTDTTEMSDNGEGRAVTTKTITNFSVTGTEMRGGVHALKVETAFSSAQTGQVDQGGGTLSIEGTGKGTAVYYVAPDGKYLGGNSTELSDIQVTTAQLPAPIPIKVTSTVTVVVLN
jgi:hypothetical protein